MLTRPILCFGFSASLLFAANVTSAQVATASLVGDLNTQSLGLRPAPSSFYEYGGSVLINAGFLLSSDGTAATTQIAVSPSVTVTGSPVAVNGAIYFAGTETGPELWVFDPVTRHAEVAAAPPFHSNPSLLTPLAGELFFAAAKLAGFPPVLWRYAPSSKTATQLAASTISDVRALLPGDERLYIAAKEGLWIYDSATATLSNADTTSALTQTAGLIRVGDQIYTSSGSSLWMYSELTRRVYQVATSLGVFFSDDPPIDAQFVELDGKLYFNTSVPAFGTAHNARRLWVHDPATMNTTLIAELHADPANPPTPNTKGLNLAGMTAAGGKLLFHTEPTCPGFGSCNSSGGTVPEEIWVYDPTNANLARLSSLRPELASWTTRVVGARADRVYAAARDPSGQEQLWSIDVPAASQASLAMIEPNGRIGAAMESSVGRVYHQHSTGGQRFRLLAVDRDGGTSEDLFPIGADGDFGTQVGVDGQPFFIGNDGTGTAIFHYVAAAGTISRVPSSANASQLVALGDELLFAAGTYPSVQLWLYSAKTNQARLAGGVDPGFTAINSLSAQGSTAYLGAATTASGAELWRYDRDSDRLQLAAELAPGTASSFPRSFVFLGPHVMFLAESSVNFTYEWVYDANSGQTWKAAIESVSSPQIVYFPKPVVFDGKFYFGLAELIEHDPLTRTERIVDVCPGTCSSNPSNLMPNGQRLFFTGITSAGGAFSLLSLQVGNVQVERAGVDPTSAMFAVGGKLAMGSISPTLGKELALYDPATSSYATIDIVPGRSGSAPANFTLVNGVLLFAAADEAHGNELWRSDGTVAGTVQVLDLNPGIFPASPSGFVQLGSTVYFSASTQAQGRELWVGSTQAITGAAVVPASVPTSTRFSVWLLALAMLAIGASALRRAAAARATKRW